MSCVALGKLFNFSVPQAPDRYNERDNTYNLKLGELSKTQGVTIMMMVTITTITVDHLELMDQFNPYNHPVKKQAQNLA